MANSIRARFVAVALSALAVAYSSYAAPILLDRKSWLFAGSDHSGERSSKARVRLFRKPFSGPERCRFHDPARTRRSQRMI
jgi:hypothetical protein